MGDIAIDMIGFKSGLLTVVDKAPSKNKRAMWKCRCECGKTKIVMGKYLRKYEVKSCGCLNRQPIGGQEKHGHAHVGYLSPTYTTWAGMKSRCYGKTSSSYYKYGARGITVCKAWHDFRNFLKDMGVKPRGKTIDRVDGSKGYYPQNCRWATPQQQARNQKTNRIITFNKKSQCLSAWAQELGISPSTLHARLKRWSKKRALTEVK